MKLYIYKIPCRGEKGGVSIFDHSSMIETPQFRSVNGFCLSSFPSLGGSKGYIVLDTKIEEKLLLDIGSNKIFMRPLYLTYIGSFDARETLKLKRPQYAIYYFGQERYNRIFSKCGEDIDVKAIELGIL